MKGLPQEDSFGILTGVARLDILAVLSRVRHDAMAANFPAADFSMQTIGILRPSRVLRSVSIEMDIENAEVGCEIRITFPYFAFLLPGRSAYAIVPFAG
jgi:hypothetical protein